MPVKTGIFLCHRTLNISTFSFSTCLSHGNSNRGMSGLSYILEQIKAFSILSLGKEFANVRWKSILRMRINCHKHFCFWSFLAHDFFTINIEFWSLNSNKWRMEIALRRIGLSSRGCCLGLEAGAASVARRGSWAQNRGLGQSSLNWRQDKSHKDSSVLKREHLIQFGLVSPQMWMQLWLETPWTINRPWPVTTSCSGPSSEFSKLKQKWFTRVDKHNSQQQPQRAPSAPYYI